jgi:hypothetical protein
MSTLDASFVLLYKELYYRHLYSKAHQQITVEHRVGSFQNYVALFDYLLSALNHGFEHLHCISTALDRFRFDAFDAAKSRRLSKISRYTPFRHDIPKL